MTGGAVRHFLRRQRKRIRRGSALQFSRRSEDTFFTRREFAKGALALVPAAVLGIAGASGPVIVLAIALGFAGLVLWAGFLFYHALTAQSRHGDRVYRLITRKHLSKEYRDG